MEKSGIRKEAAVLSRKQPLLWLQESKLITVIEFLSIKLHEYDEDDELCNDW
jgi:hypothetical protein